MYSYKNPENHLNDRGCSINPEEKDKSDKSLNRLEKEHEMKVEDMKIENQIEERRWRSCCFQLEPESSVFFAKLTVSSLVICLCGYQLITLRDCNYQSLYSSLLSSVITFWLSKK